MTSPLLLFVCKGAPSPVNVIVFLCICKRFHFVIKNQSGIWKPGLRRLLYSYGLMKTVSLPAGIVRMKSLTCHTGTFSGTPPFSMTVLSAAKFE